MPTTLRIVRLHPNYALGVPYGQKTQYQMNDSRPGIACLAKRIFMAKPALCVDSPGRVLK